MPKSITSKSKSTASKPNTIEKQYNEWLSKVYGRQNLTKIQKGEMKKAFFCGAFVMSGMMTDLSEFSEDIACTKLELLNKELMDQIVEWSVVIK